MLSPTSSLDLARFTSILNCDFFVKFLNFTELRVLFSLVKKGIIYAKTIFVVLYDFFNFWKKKYNMC